MGYYPIFLEMKGRRCVVIGGGVVAERKVQGLLEVGASVTVISSAVSERLSSWAKAGTICHRAQPYRPDDLSGFELAFVATDDPAVTAAVKREADRLGVWVNAADDPAQCHFILPSVLRRGELTVAVATGGSSPALSRAIREELEGYFTEDYTVLAEIVAEVRRELRQRALAADADQWGRALDKKLRRLIQDGKRKEGKAYLLTKLGAAICD